MRQSLLQCTSMMSGDHLFHFHIHKRVLCVSSVAAMNIKKIAFLGAYYMNVNMRLQLHASYKFFILFFRLP
jgi:hypothetical protein